MKLSIELRLACLCAAACALALTGPAASAQVSSACGDLRNAFGPWDYRKDKGEPLQLVESAHFNTAVETLIRGQTGTLGQDLDYTLRAFPNHHRALLAVSRLGDRLKVDMPPGVKYTVECYFDRAIRWRPDDFTVRMLYANWLHRKSRKAEAMTQLEIVDARAEDNPFVRFSLGLTYVELREYDAALKQAHLVQAAGLARTELKDALVAAGRWVEPRASTPMAAETAASAPAASASGPAAPASATP